MTLAGPDFGGRCNVAFFQFPRAGAHDGHIGSTLQKKRAQETVRKKGNPARNVEESREMGASQDGKAHMNQDVVEVVRFVLGNESRDLVFFSLARIRV